MVDKNNLRLHFLADSTPQALEALKILQDTYEYTDFDAADVLVALGGDGFMLHTLHKAMAVNKPVFGMNLGSVGFLMNPYDSMSLLKRIQHSHTVCIYPLRMTAQYCNGTSETYFALNEISLLRQAHQAAKIKIFVDDRVRLDSLIADGVLVATPAGSTAYNLSASGPILPLESKLMALTPISPFRPRRWRGALLPDTMSITFEILEPEKRPVSASADYQEVRHVCAVNILQDRAKQAVLLFDSNQTLAERVIEEQFLG